MYAVNTTVSVSETVTFYQVALSDFIFIPGLFGPFSHAPHACVQFVVQFDGRSYEVAGSKNLGHNLGQTEPHTKQCL